MQSGDHTGNAAAAPGSPAKKNPPAMGWRLARARGLRSTGGRRRERAAWGWRTLARSRFGWWVRF